MHKLAKCRCGFIIAVVMGALSGTVAYANTTTPTSAPIPQSVTGGDPVPTSPHSVTSAVILIFLQALL